MKGILISKYTLIMVKLVGIEEDLNLGLLDLRLEDLLLADEFLQFLVLLLILVGFLDELVEHALEVLLLVRDAIQ